MSLTKKQQAFAKGIALGLTATEAARAARYSDSSPHALRVGASRLQHHPDVQREAFMQRERRLQGPLAQKALAALEHVLDSEESPAAAKVQAARWILEAGGHGIESRRLEARIGDSDARPPHLMTLEALEAAAGLALHHVQLERDKEALAAAIEAEVIVPAEDAE
jgi:hypothetical protein